MPIEVGAYGLCRPWLGYLLWAAQTYRDRRFIGTEIGAYAVAEAGGALYPVAK